MSYPYGDESYPTFERLENKYAFEEMRHAFYYELNRQVKEAKAEFEKTRRFFNVDTDDGNGYNGSIDCGYYPEDPTAEDYGIAFARALEYALDGAEDMRYFFQDLFAILEDKIVSDADKREGDWSEDSYRAGQIGAIKNMLKSKNDLAEQYKSEYEDDISKYESERIDFVLSQVKNIEDRMNEHAQANGLSKIKLNVEVLGENTAE